MNTIADSYSPYVAVVDRPLPTALYVHVPFCLRRCGYCDFTLVAEKDDLIPAWLDALRIEFSQLEDSYSVQTVFIGGGTPTHLSCADFQTLFEIIRSRFHWDETAEVSVEANPDGLDDDRLQALRDLGVNRISLGVQSFDDDVLKFLERQHTAAEATDAVERASRHISQVSLDLIFGVPGQNLELWHKTLQHATSLPIIHLSTYGLTYEKGTSFYSRRLHGKLVPVPDELERQMYAASMNHAETAGFRHYEISNFAIRSADTDNRCRHNLTYWEARPYFAFGPGAARYLDGIRSTNDRNVVRWINKWKQGIPAIQDREQLSPEEKAREAVFLGLRQIDGFLDSDFHKRFGFSIKQLAATALERNLSAGLLQYESGRLKLTTEGLFLADSVVSDFLTA